MGVTFVVITQQNGEVKGDYASPSIYYNAALERKETRDAIYRVRTTHYALRANTTPIRMSNDPLAAKRESRYVQV